MIRIAVLNEYLDTFGGGERSTYALASTLARLGHAVDVLTTREPPSAEDIASFYGPGHDGFGLRAVAATDLPDALGEYSVLVNHSAGSSLPNPCPLGIYAVMFPFQPGGPWVSTYHHFLCNSRYTERHTRRRWGQALATRVLYPAVPAPPEVATHKLAEIVAVGRFNSGGHRKSQGFLVEAFERFASGAPGWSLTLVGKVNADRATLEELAALLERCDALPVRLLLDATDEERRDAVARASIFWHATGCEAPPGVPERMEHFGIAIAEAMAAGAVPVCFDAGGPREIVDHGENGFLFLDANELCARTGDLVEDPALRARMGERARERARRYGREAFDAGVARLFGAVISP